MGLWLIMTKSDETTQFDAIRLNGLQGHNFKIHCIFAPYIVSALANYVDPDEVPILWHFARQRINFEVLMLIND